MSDSFYSPNKLSSEKSQEFTPQVSVPAVNAQAASSTASVLNGAADDLDDLEAMDSWEESGLAEEENISFEVIADYVEAEVAEASCNSDSRFGNTNNQAGDAALEQDLNSQETIDSEDGSIHLAGLDLEQASGNDLPEETSAAEESTEAFTAPIEVVDVEILESKEQENAYEVHQDGNLTYFQYFLDEEESGFGPGYGDWRDDPSNSPRSFVSATAVGVGVLAATFGAGLLMAEATNRSSSISDGSKGSSSESKIKADAERNASEAAELAKASSPETDMPDWSTTQKAIAVSEGSALANPALGSSTEALSPDVSSPASSSVTSKLAPLSQAWGASVPLPPPSLPIAPPPTVVTPTSLPTPTVAPVSISALQPIPSYQVVQPPSTPELSSPIASAALPAPPVVQNFQQDEQQLRTRMENLRDRISEPIAAGTVPISSDGSLLDAPDERWVSNIPNRINVPSNEAGTTLDSAFESPALPSLTDSPYVTTMVSQPTELSPSVDSVNTAAPTPIAAAPQAPLELNPVVPPHQASSLTKQVVAPVAGLLPAPVAATQPETLPPQTSVAPAESAEQVEDPAQLTQAVELNPAPELVQEQASMDITPGAIALEVIPPTISTPVLTAPLASDATVTDSDAVAVESQSSARQSQALATSDDADAQLSTDITSLRELIGMQSSRPLALSRATAKAALEGAEQLEQFRILPLAVSEYQRLWQESGNDETFAPVHGFVDYGQNLIAVLVPRGEATEVGSADVEIPLMPKLSNITNPVLTEVSAKPAIPVEAVSQS